MDAYEATRVVFSRIQSLDPENAPKIMGFLLIQDNGEKEMIRLAFGPEALVYSIVLKARKELGLHGSTVSSYRQIFTSSALGPLSPSLPMSPSSSSSSSSYSSSSSSSSPPAAAAGPVFSRNGNEGIRLGSPSDKIIGPNSYMVIGTSNLVSSFSSSSSTSLSSSSSSSSSSTASSFSSSSLSSSSVQEYNYNNNNNNNNSGPFFGDMIDEFQLQEQLSFLNEHPTSIDSPNSTHSLPIGGPKNDMFYPAETESKSEDAAALFSYANWANGSLGSNGHRRSCSVADICLASEASGGSGYGWKPCLYFARGYCKNGSSCRFLHSFPDSQTAGTSELDAIVRKQQQQQLEVEQYQELLTRSKSQRLASAPQLMAAAAAFPYPTAKCVLPVVQTDNYLHNCISISDNSNSNSNPNQRLQHNTLFLTDDDATTQKFISRSPRIERNEFGGGISTPGSRQIYLTFPADSTFREEDVSNYFSIYGPVQDVRIPYQQKRMFGFVTFVYPETVKIILAKGNPHFVCDARVLVKPYKEKGKVGDKKHNERGDFSGYTTPNSFDSREAYDLQLGARIFYNSQEVLRRKLEEQSDLQQAIELQGRRLMELQLLDVKKRHLPSRIMATNQFYHSTAPSTQGMSPEGIHIPAADNCPSPSTATSDPRQQINYGMPQQQQAAVSTTTDKESSSIEDSPPKDASDYYQDSLEHNLPDSPFASPTKTVGDSYSIFSTETSATPNGVSNNLITSSLLPASPTLDMASFKSCYFQMPRFSSGPGAIGM